ncbi:MAG: glycine cleavage system aminomethyltransferase GcvT [Thermoflexales bacterium]|nr:glycine cleavage system aminomethyltransferase GcvT [Thermoflexales bacterium]
MAVNNMDDFLFRGELSELDPQTAELIACEAERQVRKLIMIPSESMAPQAVLQAEGSVFQNIYAEGYPPPRTRAQSVQEILDYEDALAYFRRVGAPRYYMGTEYVDMVEALARRRCAELFATGSTPAGNIFVNVQPLSGSPANLAVYKALLEPGEVLMGMSLLHGGHLSHGSPANWSGQFYSRASYSVNAASERLDYDEIAELAASCKPRVIVAGYTSYPYAPDWAAFREIADSVGAYLLADISHVAGLVCTGAFPSPVGYAHVVSFTTHKTLCGPRGACILTTDEKLARRIDRAVFPGGQGGPHINTIAAMAVAFNLAASPQFAALQKQIVANARHLVKCLQEQGLRVAYGGTDSHMLVLDCKTIHASDGTPFPNGLMGDPAVRILDLAGIVANRNTIPGDDCAARASGVRLGTPWITQRGLREPEMERLAEAIAKALQTARPYPGGAKVNFDALEESKLIVQELVAKTGADVWRGYPHFWTLQDAYSQTAVTFEIAGVPASSFLQLATTNDVSGLEAGGEQATFLLEKDGQVMSGGVLCRAAGENLYQLIVPGQKAARVAAWLRALSDGYVAFDDDPRARLPGPIVVRQAQADHTPHIPLPMWPTNDERPMTDGPQLKPETTLPIDLSKPYFIGQAGLALAAPQSDKLKWAWSQPAGNSQRTPLYEEHRQLGAKLIPFAGWDMPVWYTGVSEEHGAVRQAAGLFDVAHMGVFEIEGEHALSFLDAVASNDAGRLADGRACYAYLLDPDGNVIDDFFIYRLAASRLLLVVNAVNENKDWDWLNAVNGGQVVIDRQRPWVQVQGRAELRNLKDPAEGERQKRDLALQGPNSAKILQALTGEPAIQQALGRMCRNDVIETELAGIPLVAARTGYTGERMGFELFVHPEHLRTLWRAILEVGDSFGVKPCGLAARDSTRTEAGLPLYGHELAGPYAISPAEAGFAAYVKYHKPFFIGRRALQVRDAERKRELVRWRMSQKGVRRPETGAPVVERRGQVIGYVTSCSIDSEGYLLGLALVDRQHTKVDTPLGIFVLPAGKSQPERPKGELAVGERVLVPVEAVVLSRFPSKKSPRPAAGNGGSA